MDIPICLLVEVPVCAFRPFTSREYQDTFPVPTPSTVYGMLLSLVGEPSSPNADNEQRHLAKEKHRGVEMALVVDAMPERSRVFRKLRRGDIDERPRPDYQDVLTELRLRVWLRKGRDQGQPSLPERVHQAITKPETVTRFGGLSLGESSYLINSIRQVPGAANAGCLLKPDKKGFYNLPIWVDHRDSRQSITTRFSIVESSSVGDEIGQCWFAIGFKEGDATGN